MLPNLLNIDPAVKEVFTVDYRLANPFLSLHKNKLNAHFELCHKSVKVASQQHFFDHSI